MLLPHYSKTRDISIFTILTVLLAILLVTYGFVYFYLFNTTNQEQRKHLHLLTESLHHQILSSADAQKRTYLKAAAENTLQALRTISIKQNGAALSESEARWIGSGLILGQETDNEIYSFAFDAKGTIRVHPDSSRKGSQITGDEVPYADETVAEGFFHFTRPGAQNQQAEDMEGYVSYFRPWNWYIVTSIPVRKTAELIDFEIIKSSLAQAELFAGHNIVLYFDDGTLWYSDFKQKGEQRSGPSEFSTIAATIRTKKNGAYTYDWLSDLSSTPVEKDIVFKELPELGLIAAVAAPQVEDNTALLLPYKKLLFFLSGAILVLFVLSLVKSQMVSRPLQRLLTRLKTQEDTQDPIDPPPHQPDAIKELIEHINATRTRLKDAEEALSREQQASEAIHDQLRNEIITREKAHQQLTTEVITRKSAENYLQLFKNIFDNAIEGIIITDKDSRILTVNQSFTDITGYSAGDVVGQNPNILSSGNQSKGFYQQMWQSLKEEGSWFGEIINRKKDGAILPEWLSISQIKDSNNQVTHYFAFFHDITELKAKEQQISFMAYRDALTKLPNRAALEGRLSKAIAQAKRSGGSLAVLFIDLDNFKNINDTMGHDKGDQVLIQVAKRLSTVIRTSDTLSRLGGDEFILLSESIENENSIYHLAGRILSSLKEPFYIGFSELFINASIGIATYPNDGKTTNDLIKNADMAMYRAKHEGKNKFVLFTKEMHENFLTHVRIENSIRTGLQKKEFVVFYQPKVSIPHQTPTSFEALVRWNKNGLIIGPNKFVPVAEESGLIDKMGLYVLEEVCTFLKRLHAQDMELLPVSVNMAPRTFNNPDIVETIDQLLDSYNIGHEFIEFEITETTAMNDIQHTLKTMKRFRNRGISFSIDDFGTGYSSLSYLTEMPVSTLKIDRSFISAGDSNSKSIVSTITAMSKQLGLKVVAEGVETNEQLYWLNSLGCNEAQGFLFATPMNEEETLDYLTGKHWLNAPAIAGEQSKTGR